jgi:hypothetical protein
MAVAQNAANASDTPARATDLQLTMRLPFILSRPHALHLATPGLTARPDGRPWQVLPWDR